MCGLSLATVSDTYFTLAVTGELEINLVTVYDFCRNISDTIAWNIWAERSGNIYFKNRKPFPMYGTSGQPGDVNDVPISVTLTGSNTISIEHKLIDANLRNRIVVYGSGVNAVARAASPYLPTGFYRTAVIGAEMMLDTQAGCQDAADYNLALYNRLTESITMTVLGDQNLRARRCINLYTSNFPSSVNFITDGKWYIYSCEHNFSSAGYTCELDLRKE
jgi:hypothetical protein